MKKNEFDTNRVHLMTMNKMTRFYEPIRCNHLVLVLCREGSLEIELNYSRYNLLKNGFLIVTPFDIIAMKKCTDDFCCTTLIMPAFLFTPLLHDINIPRYEYVKQNPVTYLREEYLEYVVQVLDILEKARRMVDDDVFDKIAEKQLASLFLAQQDYLRKCGQANNEHLEYVPRKKELFRNFIQSLLKSHSLSREVLFYANELGISSGYLNEICNDVSSHSAKDIIDSTVMARLKFELSYTSKSVQELADEYNFPSQSYFTRYYKRLTGMTPSEFRKSRAAEFI